MGLARVRYFGKSTFQRGFQWLAGNCLHPTKNKTRRYENQTVKSKKYGECQLPLLPPPKKPFFSMLT